MPAPSNLFAHRRAIALRAIYGLCLLGATFNHAASIYRHGLFWNPGGLPQASVVFWTALVLFDPAAVLLLVVRPHAGVLATVLIIVVDVAHNVWIEARYYPPLLPALASAPQVVAQIVFMVFVLASARFAVEPGTAPQPWSDRA